MRLRYFSVWDFPLLNIFIQYPLSCYDLFFWDFTLYRHPFRFHSVQHRISVLRSLDSSKLPFILAPVSLCTPSFIVVVQHIELLLITLRVWYAFLILFNGHIWFHHTSPFVIFSPLPFTHFVLLVLRKSFLSLIPVPLIGRQANLWVSLWITFSAPLLALYCVKEKLSLSMPDFFACWVFASFLCFLQSTNSLLFFSDPLSLCCFRRDRCLGIKKKRNVVE